MNFKGYSSRIICEEDGIFYRDIANIRDVVTFQGRTKDELRYAFEESVMDYLDFCRKRRESPNSPC